MVHEIDNRAKASGAMHSIKLKEMIWKCKRERAIEASKKSHEEEEPIDNQFR